ncbi:hypothetical protein SHJG_5286 [Streptomyces hygroscopicus subsp. jinggangensis 5008]|nr:hypothetical protein SHJG_5286 [Streptomyces hygroscopicus subsp. jinggangensis 5008]AGF64713.1 hypothetical protein SHJGH_5050 [Streptomyces hygroscopicus subsp. jinggangensis TL01]
MPVSAGGWCVGCGGGQRPGSGARGAGQAEAGGGRRLGSSSGR